MYNIHILDFFLKSNFLVQFTVFILVFCSVFSWGIIIQRIIIIKFIVNQNKSFEYFFKKNNNIMELYKKYSINSSKLIGLKKIFFAAVNEFIVLKTDNICNSNMLFKLMFKFIKISIERELELIEKNVFFLGIIGSISPYIGLFGTLLGVINTLLSFGSVKYINIQIIAPGIAEALILTILGLFVAIPAIIAFNFFNYKTNKMEQIYKLFLDEFLIMLNLDKSIDRINYFYDNKEK